MKCGDACWQIPVNMAGKLWRVTVVASSDKIALVKATHLCNDMSSGTNGKNVVMEIAGPPVLFHEAGWHKHSELEGEYHGSSGSPVKPGEPPVPRDSDRPLHRVGSGSRTEVGV